MTIDWDNGIWTKAAGKCAGPRQKIVIAGDWAPIRRYENITGE